MSKMTLDQLLELAHEEEPQDDGFVRVLMGDVKKEEQRRWRLKLVRRPVVAGIVTVVVATSGAVAALVGTHTSPKPQAVAPSGTASVSVSAPPASAPASSLPGPLASAPAPAKSAAPAGLHWGQSAHTAWIIDDVTGLKLTTETYGNSFAVGRPQMVTLTLLNTSPDTMAISGSDGCPLQIVTSIGGKPGPQGCAQGAVPQDTFVLAPGGSQTVSAEITLPSAGSWNIVGLCKCTSQTTPDATDKTAPVPTRLSGDPLALTQQPVDVPQISASIPGKSSPAPTTTRLQTPPITVKAT